jgi:hypothetical protein
MQSAIAATERSHAGQLALRLRLTHSPSRFEDPSEWRASAYAPFGVVPANALLDVFFVVDEPNSQYGCSGALLPHAHCRARAITTTQAHLALGRAITVARDEPPVPLALERFARIHTCGSSA